MTQRLLTIAAAMLISLTAISTTASVGPVAHPVAMGASTGAIA